MMITMKIGAAQNGLVLMAEELAKRISEEISGTGDMAVAAVYARNIAKLCDGIDRMFYGDDKVTISDPTKDLVDTLVRLQLIEAQDAPQCRTNEGLS